MRLQVDNGPPERLEDRKSQRVCTYYYIHMDSLWRSLGCEISRISLHYVQSICRFVTSRCDYPITAVPSCTHIGVLSSKDGRDEVGQVSSQCSAHTVEDLGRAASQGTKGAHDNAAQQ